MKKYISILVVVLVTFISSCSNDEITITNGISVKVDPSGVIAPFTYENQAGELESFSASYKLRTRVLAYDERGRLVAADTAFLTNYKSIMNSILYLSKGTYTLLAITDIVRRTNDVTTLQYWKLENEQNINSLKVIDQGMIGGKSKILGIATQKIIVSSGAESFAINPQAAGALLSIEFYNIHKFTDVTRYELQANRSCDFLTFNALGQYIATPENNNNQYSWRNCILEPQSSVFLNRTEYTTYSFLFPMNNVSFRFAYFTENTSNNVIIDNMTVNLKAGDEYVFQLQCNENYTSESSEYKFYYYYNQVNGSSSAPVNSYSVGDTPTVSAPSLNVSNKATRVLDLIKRM